MASAVQEDSRMRTELRCDLFTCGDVVLYKLVSEDSICRNWRTIAECGSEEWLGGIHEL